MAKIPKLKSPIVRIDLRAFGGGDLPILTFGPAFVFLRGILKKRILTAHPACSPKRRGVNLKSNSEVKLLGLIDLRSLGGFTFIRKMIKTGPIQSEVGKT